MERYKNDTELTPEWLANEWRRLDADVEGWMNGSCDDVGPLRRVDAEYLARLALPNGLYLTAFTFDCDIEEFGLSITVEEAHEYLIGADVDRLCAERHLQVDLATRLLLLREVAQAVRFAAKKLLRNLEGDYSPDLAATRFPPYEAPTDRPTSSGPG